MIPEIIIGNNIILWVSTILTISIGLIVKDVLVNFTSGLLFFLNRNFNEGDLVYLDSELCRIIRIGIRYTVFEIEKEGVVCWRFISNDRVKFSKIDKIISK